MAASTDKPKKKLGRAAAVILAMVAAAVLLALLLPDKGQPAVSGSGGSAPAEASRISSQAPASPAESVSAEAASQTSQTSQTASASPAESGEETTAAENAPAADAPAGDAYDFSDAAFVGNSFVEDLDTYNLVPAADCFARVGLNVQTALTKPTLRGEVPIIDELKAKQYGKVILVFGENELGWASADTFARYYGELIDQVRQRQPAAVVYIESIFPVSAAVSAENKDQLNNQRIGEFNDRLQRLAEEKGAVYIDGASVLRDAQGELPADAATDGIHPKIGYYREFVEYLRTHL